MAWRRTGGHLVVGDHAPVLPCQLDQHRALGVVDPADRRRLEADEGLEVGKPAAVEVDVVDEAHRGQQEQGQERRREASSRDAERVARHPRGYAAPDDAEPRGHRGAAVGQPSEVGPEPACGPHRLGSGVWRGPFGSSAGVGETWSVGTGCGSLWSAAALRCGQS